MRQCNDTLFARPKKLSRNKLYKCYAYLGRNSLLFAIVIVPIELNVSKEMFFSHGIHGRIQKNKEKFLLLFLRDFHS